MTHYKKITLEEIKNFLENFSIKISTNIQSHEVFLGMNSIKRASEKDIIFYRILSVLISIIIVFFCIYMIMNKIKMPSDLALFLGSLAGATAVENIGNSKFINKNELLRQIQFSIK